MYDEDFVNEEVVEFEIENKKFSYKPVTAGEENEWLNDCMIIDDSGKAKQDFSKLNKCKAMNIKKVAYDKETIQKIIGIEKEWSELNTDEKWKLLGKLKPTVFDKIFKKINGVDASDDIKKKDLSTQSTTVIQK